MERDIVDQVAHEIALEFMEATSADRCKLQWPDDFVGDTIDRAECLAARVVAMVRTSEVTR